MVQSLFVFRKYQILEDNWSSNRPNLPTIHSLVIDLFRAYYMPSNERHWKETKFAAVIAATLQRDKISLSDLNQRNKSVVYSIPLQSVVLKETVIGKPRVNPLLSAYLKWWNGSNRVVTSAGDKVFELSDHIVLLCLYTCIYIFNNTIKKYSSNL